MGENTPGTLMAGAYRSIAQYAYFMLLRAKVEDSRFLAVEGYADRNLRNKADPLAAENRRIEILIKGAES